MKKKINLPLIIILSLVVFLVFTVFIKNVHPEAFLNFLENGEIRDTLVIGSTVFFLYNSPLPYRSSLKGIPNLSSLGIGTFSIKVLAFFILILILIGILGFVLSKTLENNSSPLKSLIIIASTLFLLSLGSKYINDSIILDSSTFNNIINQSDPNAYIIEDDKVSMVTREDKNLAYITDNSNNLDLESLVHIKDVKEKTFMNKLSDFSKTPKGVTILLLLCGSFMYGIRTFKKFSNEMTELSELVQIDMDEYIYNPKDNINFNNIIGFEKEKKRLISLADGKEKNICSILIQGEKGIGKTTLGKAFLNEFENSHYIPGHKLITHYTGGGNQILDLLFNNEDVDGEPKVIFIDNLDLLNEKQFIILEGSSDEDILSNLKLYMAELKKRNIILIVSARNISKTFDKSLRSRDFDLTLNLNYPNYEDTKKLASKFAQDLKVNNINLDTFAKNNSKKTPLELYNLIYKRSLEEAKQNE